ncbi:hypothetical protein ACROYT_G030296 [Oculina patagonica]
MGSFSAASEMNNTSSYALSDIRFEENLATLSEMFPAHDVAVLRNYLESFHDNPNCMSIVVGMLLEGEGTPDLNSGQNSSQQQHGLKRKTDTVTSEDSLHDEDQSETVATSPSKLQKVDICINESGCSSLPTVLGKIDKLDSNKSETLTSFGSHSVKKEEPSSSNPDKSEPGPSRSSEHFTGELASSVDKDDDEIVFVKSVESSPKQSFCRTEQSKSEVTSPKQRNGICIRHKGGVLHPSMNKPKKLQIVRIDVDGKTGASNVQTPVNKDQSKTSLSPGKKMLINLTSIRAVIAAATTDINGSNDSSPRPCTSIGPSTSEEKATESPATVNSLEHPGSAELEQTEEETPSNLEDSEGSSGAAALSDLEILKKVFPDADPTYISSLLDKHADKPNRVALVGKELGNNTATQEQNTKKKVVPSVIWFWESEGGKLVPFTDSECNALEKEFNSCDPNGPGNNAYVKVVKLPGSAKRFTVDFSAMQMVCESGQKMMIFRVPGGSDERKEIGGKSLIPQEALLVPNDWQQQSGNAELISVRPGSAEWDHVQRSLKRSLRAAVVVDIQRVQNKWLYRKYAIQRHLLKDKNGPTCINEKELFHGTRQKNPDVIWTGEDGFDMRYSADGMWGRGTYFASEAAYCHQGFVYRDQRTKQFQLFLAHVLTGDSISLPPNRGIKMPPLKTASNIRYDSVNGVTNGCTVYILYKLDMAYPAYLITYTLRQ